jgi:hypothetical protein
MTVNVEATSPRRRARCLHSRREERALAGAGDAGGAMGRDDGPVGAAVEADAEASTLDQGFGLRPRQAGEAEDVLFRSRIITSSSARAEERSWRASYASR